MSGTVSRGREAGQQAEALAAAEAGAAGRRRRVGWVAAGLVVVLAAGVAVGVAGGGVFRGALARGRAWRRPRRRRAVVTRQDLAATTPVTATLGYAGSWTVTGQGGGTLTWLPPAGQVIGQGQVLYRVDNGSPVVLLYGSVPDWRALGEGMTGADVSQLNHDLVALGYAGTRGGRRGGLGLLLLGDGVRGAAAGRAPGGVRSRRGRCRWGRWCSSRRRMRVTQVTGSLGGPASGPVLTATSDRHVVTIALDASQQSEVQAGDTVTVTLPDGTTTPGVVSSVGTVATTSARSGGTTHDDPGAGEADRPGGGRQPGPGAGDGEHHHCHRARRAGGAGDGAAGPVAGRVRRGGRRPREHAAVRAGDAGDLRRQLGPGAGDRGADPRAAGRGGGVMTAARAGGPAAGAAAARPGRRCRCWSWSRCRRCIRGRRRCGRWIG